MFHSLVLRDEIERPMKKDLFGELMQSVGEAAEHARGKRDLRTTVLPEAPDALSAADIRAMPERQRTVGAGVGGGQASPGWRSTAVARDWAPRAGDCLPGPC